MSSELGLDPRLSHASRHTRGRGRGGGEGREELDEGVGSQQVLHARERWEGLSASLLEMTHCADTLHWGIKTRAGRAPKITI